MAKEKKNDYAYIAIVAIVAIVALVVLMSGNGVTKETPSMLLEESEENIVGQAMRGEQTAPKSPTQSIPYIDPTDCVEVSGVEQNYNGNVSITYQATCPTGRVITSPFGFHCGAGALKSANPILVPGKMTGVIYVTCGNINNHYMTLDVTCCKVIYP